MTRINFVSVLIVTLLTVALMSCGGGGSGSAPSPSPPSDGGGTYNPPAPIQLSPISLSLGRVTSRVASDTTDPVTITVEVNNPNPVNVLVTAYTRRSPFTASDLTVIPPLGSDTHYWGGFSTGGGTASLTLDKGAGKYYVIAWAEAAGYDPSWSNTLGINLSFNQEGEAMIDPIGISVTPTLIIRVEDEQGDPVDDAEVAVSALTSQNWEGQTATDGECRISLPELTGDSAELTISITKEGYLPATRTITIDLSEDEVSVQVVEFILHPIHLPARSVTIEFEENSAVMTEGGTSSISRAVSDFVYDAFFFRLVVRDDEHPLHPPCPDQQALLGSGPVKHVNVDISIRTDLSLNYAKVISVHVYKLPGGLYGVYPLIGWGDGEGHLTPDNSVTLPCLNGADPNALTVAALLAAANELSQRNLDWMIDDAINHLPELAAAAVVLVCLLEPSPIEEIVGLLAARTLFASGVAAGATMAIALPNPIPPTDDATITAVKIVNNDDDQLLVSGTLKQENTVLASWGTETVQAGTTRNLLVDYSVDANHQYIAEIWWIDPDTSTQYTTSASVYLLPGESKTLTLTIAQHLPIVTHTDVYYTVVNQDDDRLQVEAHLRDTSGGDHHVFGGSIDAGGAYTSPVVALVSGQNYTLSVDWTDPDTGLAYHAETTKYVSGSATSLAVSMERHGGAPQTASVNVVLSRYPGEIFEDGVSIGFPQATNGDGYDQLFMLTVQREVGSTHTYSFADYYPDVKAPTSLTLMVPAGGILFRKNYQCYIDGSIHFTSTAWEQWDGIKNIVAWFNPYPRWTSSFAVYVRDPDGMEHGVFDTCTFVYFEDDPNNFVAVRVPIGGSTNRAHIFTKSGNYALILWNANNGGYARGSISFYWNGTF